MKKSKWTSAQIKMLLEKTKSGSIRMHAFDEIAKKTNRKPNSVRNFYYKKIATEKASFASFGKNEIENLLREIVLGTSRGESIRSICLRLASGNMKEMLRLQNKYRAILKKHPQQIEQTTQVLEGQGFFVKSPITTKAIHSNIAPVVASKSRKFIEFTSTGSMPLSPEQSVTDNIVTMPAQTKKNLTDADINNLFMGLVRLVKKQAKDEQIAGLKNQINLLKAEIEHLKNKDKTLYTSK